MRQISAFLVCMIFFATLAPAAQLSEEQEAEFQRLFVEADKAWHAGDYEQCIQLNLRLVEIDPTYIEGYIGAAWLLWSTDRDREALEVYHRGITANPDDYQLYHDVGMYYFTRKYDYRRAADYFRQAVDRLHPPIIERMLAHALERSGRVEEALEMWKGFAEKQPEDVAVKRNLERLSALAADSQQMEVAASVRSAYQLEAEGHLSQAVMIWHKLLNANPDSYSFYLNYERVREAMLKGS